MVGFAVAGRCYSKRRQAMGNNDKRFLLRLSPSFSSFSSFSSVASLSSLLLFLALLASACATLREGPIASDHDESASGSPPPPTAAAPVAAAAGASSSNNAIDPPRGGDPQAQLLGTIDNVPFRLREATAFQKAEATGPNGYTTTLILHLHDHVGFCSRYIASETASGSTSITLSIVISRDTSPEITVGRYNVGEPTNWSAKTITTVRAHAMRANATTCANDFPASSRNAKPGGSIEILRLDHTAKLVSARFDLEFGNGDRIQGEVNDVQTCPSASLEGRIPQGCSE